MASMWNHGRDVTYRFCLWTIEVLFTRGATSFSVLPDDVRERADGGAFAR